MKLKEKLLLCASSFFCIFTVAFLPVHAETLGGAVVHTSSTGLNLRAEPSTGAPSLGMVQNGAFLLVEEQLDGWYKVVYNGEDAYVSSSYADFRQELDGNYSFDASTQGTDVFLRAGAGTETGVVRIFTQPREGLTVTGVSGRWLKIQTAEGAEGYIRSDLVRYKRETAAAQKTVSDSTAVESPAPAPAASSSPSTAPQANASGSQTASSGSVGEQIAAKARELLNYPYVWGGANPASGFDCSGLVYYLYGLQGHTLERVAQNMYYTNGYAISRSELRPGDLLFFGYGEDSIYHVALYVGNGQMIHASTSKTGVILSELDSWQNFVGAKRVVS